MLTAVLRTAGDPAALGRTVQQQVLTVDPDVPAYRLRTGDQLLGDSLARRRLLMTLISSFAAIALVLALPVLYGLPMEWRSARARSAFAWLWAQPRAKCSPAQRARAWLSPPSG